MMRKIKYTKEILESAVKDSNSIKDVLRKFDVGNSGGMHNYLSKRIKEYNIDTSHFIKQRECYKYLEGHFGNKMEKDEFLQTLKEYRHRSTNLIKLRLIYFEIKEHRCEICGNTNWNENKIPLELHHKDGDSANNNIENLQLICPNCHAQTENYRGKKNKKIIFYEKE